MGKKMTKKNRPEQPRERGYLRAGAMVLLVLVGVGALAGLAAMNGNAKPRRNMKWYVGRADVQVAAPPQGEGYAATAGVATVRDTERAEAPALAELPEATEAAGPDEAVIAAPEAENTTEEPGAATPEPVDEGEEALSGEASEGEDEALSDEASEGEDETLPEGVEEAEDAVPEEEQVVGPVTLKITAVGDCTFGGQEGSKSYRRFKDAVKESGYDYFFNNVRQIFEDDDLTIVNLEGPLTTSTKVHSHGYAFKADPSCVQILTGSSVELCNLANNHSLDYGTEGLKETARVLEENGVGYCGFTEAYNAVIKGVRVTALGFTKWDHTEEDIAKAVSAARENCDLLIVNMHWGWERQYDFDDWQTSLGHAAIDAGADLVIGTHPHVYQGIEKYKGRYIVYSLGNFCFAGNANPKDKRCLIFQQTFSFTPGMGIAQANFMDAGINLIPANVSSVRDKNDFIPTVMPAEEGAELLKAVASHSRKFSFSDTLWMKDNYMVTYGLVKAEEQRVAEGDPETAELEDGDAPAEAAEEEADGGSPEEAPDAEAI